MSTKADWIWVTLTQQQIAHAEAVVDREIENVKRWNLPQTRGTHPYGERWQKRIGAQGEVAFDVARGRPLRSVDEMTSTWKGPDVDGFSVKTISRDELHLMFQDDDVKPNVKAFVLMFNACPRLAIVGRISLWDALEKRVWDATLRWPAWVVHQKYLDPWWDETEIRI